MLSLEIAREMTLSLLWLFSFNLFHIHIDQLAQLVQEIKVLRLNSNVVQFFIWKKLKSTIILRLCWQKFFCLVEGEKYENGKMLLSWKTLNRQVPAIVWEKLLIEMNYIMHYIVDLRNIFPCNVPWGMKAKHEGVKLSISLLFPFRLP